MALAFDDDPKRRQRSDAAINAARIVEVARHAWRKDPDVTMARIAEAAGLGRGTVYRHFPNRQALLEAVRGQAREDREVDQDDHLRPPGELTATPGPLSVTEVLNKVPPHQLGEQIVAEASRIAGVTAAALYLVDLDGTLLLRLAGAPTFPSELTVPLAVGPEIPREGIPPLREAIERELPGALLAPLYLRGRATGLLVALGRGEELLRDLAAEAAAAISLADHYTDSIESVRRARHTSPAAEIQQNLLPPRIVRIGGAKLAGNVLPGYAIGGDWFDYAENASCAWLGIADVEGAGARAAALGSVLLGAFRSARHQDRDVEGAAELMHEVLIDVGVENGAAAATIGCWNAPTQTFRWVALGRPAPLLIPARGAPRLLEDVLPLLGSPDLRFPVTIHEYRLEPGDRVLLVSDGVTDRTDAAGEPFAMDGVIAAARKAERSSAAATVRAVEDAARAHLDGDFEDDATVVCLAC